MTSRLLATAVVALTLVVPAQAEARPRDMSVDYTGAPLAGAGNAWFGVRCGTECLEFTTARRGEAALHVSVRDATGRAVGWVAETEAGVKASGCGSGVVPSAPREHWWVSTAAVGSCQAAPTSGTLGVRLAAH